MKTTAHRVRSIDRSLGSGRRTLRISLIEGDGDSEPTLIFASGFGRGPGFNRPDWLGSPIRIPAASAPALIAAIRELCPGAERGKE